MVNPHGSGAKAVTLTEWNALLALTALWYCGYVSPDSSYVMVSKSDNV